MSGRKFTRTDGTYAHGALLQWSMRTAPAGFSFTGEENKRMRKYMARMRIGELYWHRRQVACWFRRRKRVLLQVATVTVMFVYLVFILFCRSLRDLRLQQPSL